MTHLTLSEPTTKARKRLTEADLIGRRGFGRIPLLHELPRGCRLYAVHETSPLRIPGYDIVIRYANGQELFTSSLKGKAEVIRAVWRNLPQKGTR